jgi:hypothetical protein
MRIRYLALFLGMAAAALAQSHDAMFDKLADRYYNDVVFHYDPASGTQAGFHQYDPLLASGARREVQAEIAALRGFEAEVAGFEPRGLSAFAAADRELLLSQIRGQLLELESIRPWEKNPDLYSSGAAGAIFVIMSRNYAPPAERLKSVIARERHHSTAIPVGAREPQQPAARLHGSCDGAGAGHRRFLPDRCAGGLQDSDRPGAAG